MSDNQYVVSPTIDIDALLQDTWLQVISLRHDPEFSEGEGLTLWNRCVAEVERVQNALKAAGLGESHRQHILMAQCALLDEAVKSRGVQDDACVQWYNIPLQGHFLGTMEAGDTLCQRMIEVLNDPTPECAVLTCFHRVMLLGFLGSYRTLKDPEREKLITALSAKIPPFRFSQEQPILARTGDRSRMGSWLSTWPVRIGLSVIAVTALWWVLDHRLTQMVATLLPGVPQ